MWEGDRWVPLVGESVVHDWIQTGHTEGGHSRWKRHYDNHGIAGWGETSRSEYYGSGVCCERAAPVNLCM